jgi:hypothetical protein
MKRTALVALAAALGCLRQPSPAQPASASQVQPEAPAAPLAHAAPVAPAPGVGAAHLGAPLTVTERTSLASILATPARFAGQTVRLEGTVSAVCQAAGCWMQLAENDARVHIKMHGHSFFIPRTATGRHARVQGIVISGNPNGHCEQEAEAATGQVARLELDATGVELD